MPLNIVSANIDCAVPHDDPFHSTTLLFPTAQHNVVDGHDMPDSPFVPDIDCETPHDVPFHSIAWTALPLLYPTAQHSVVDGHDMLFRLDINCIDCAVPHVPAPFHSIA
jgi:hypothetical protein